MGHTSPGLPGAAHPSSRKVPSGHESRQMVWATPLTSLGLGLTLVFHAPIPRLSGRGDARVCSSYSPGFPCTGNLPVGVLAVTRAARKGQTRWTFTPASVRHSLTSRDSPSYSHARSWHRTACHPATSFAGTPVPWPPPSVRPPGCLESSANIPHLTKRGPNLCRAGLKTLHRGSLTDRRHHGPRLRSGGPV